MAEEVPPFVLGRNEDGSRVVIFVDPEREATDFVSLAALAPGLVQPAAAAQLARAVNHLAQGSRFEVVTDPAAYEAAYRARLASEDPTAPWTEGVMRVSDFGMPDFAAMAPPFLEGSLLEFFAADRVLMVPYRVQVDLDAADSDVSSPAYVPLPLEPLDVAVVVPPSNLDLPPVEP